MPMIWVSLVKGLSTCWSRKVICLRRASRSTRLPPAIRFMPATRSASELATTKSSPLSMNAFTGGGVLLSRRLAR